MHKNRQRETKQVFTKRKIGEHLVNIAMLGLTITPAISAAATVYAEEASNEATASTDVSAQLKAAIEKAKSLGIKVDSTEKKTFQSTAELNDFNAKQLAQLNEAIAKAEKNVSTSKSDEDEYNKAKAEYDKKKADYDTKKAAYDKAKAEYDAAKTKYDADLKTYEAAKTKYDSDLKAYESAKTKYDSDLKAYESSTASNKKAQEEYNKKKAEYDTAKAKYDADLKTYEAAKADYDRKLAEYESGSANDKKAQEEYARKKAEYDAAKAKYDSDLAKYNNDKVEYDRKIAEMEANKGRNGWLKEAVSQNLVFKSEPSARTSVVAKTDAAPISASGLKRAFDIVGLDRFYIDELVNNRSAFETAISSVSGSEEAMSIPVGKQGMGGIGNSSITAYRISRNSSITVAYTNLRNSTYAGKNLSKVEMTISIDPSSRNLSQNGIFAFAQDPKYGFNVQFRKADDNNKNYALKFDITVKFYDASGNLINLDSDAYLAMSSLNSHITPIGIVEGFMLGSGTEEVGITGSSIQRQGNMYFSNKEENTMNQFGQENIDAADNPYFWYLASALRLKGTSPTFKVFSVDPSVVGRYNFDRTYIPGLWMTVNTDIAAVTAIKPNKPTEPTPPTPPGNTSRTKPSAPTPPTQPTPPTPLVIPDTSKPEEPKKPTEPTKPTEPKAPTAPVEPTAPVKKTTNNSDPINVKIAEASLVITKHIDITTGKELHPQEEGTKPKRSFDGYEFVETKTKDGNTIHYYKPVDKTPIKPKEDKAITKHFDITTGKEIAPQEDGNQPKKDIPNYEFVETKTKTGETDHYYKPISKPITRHIDKDTGKDIVPPEDGNKPKKDIPGYRFVETKDKDGNTNHYYQKVHTRHYDITTGKELVPQEDGTQPKKDIPNYEFVETKDKDGDTEHFYKPVKKVYTKHIDKKTGKELVPQEDGKQPKKDIPGYRFVETKDEDGNTIHYYEQVITKHLEVGTNKELAPQEDGQQPKKDIEGYEFVETKDDNGDTIHYYKPVKKVYTKHIDKSTGKELAPQEDGKQPKRDFDGYKFVETKDEDGNTIHYYEPIAKVITKHIDIDTNEEIAQQEDGKQPKKDISDYEFVETKDDNGNTLHYYRKVKKPAAIKGKTPAKYADTNEAAGIVQSVIGALGLTSLAGFGFLKKRKK